MGSQLCGPNKVHPKIQPKQLNQHLSLRQQKDLTQERAEARAIVIQPGSISYNFNLHFQDGASYQGLAEIDFTLLRLTDALPLDFKSPNIKKVVINGKNAEILQQQLFLFLETKHLLLGPNHVQIWYGNNYNNDGGGCVSFIDVDKKQYIYAHFEPYFGNRVFPMFDQPDMKAQMKLNTLIPTAWKRVVSNELPICNKVLNKQEYLKIAKTAKSTILQEYLSSRSGQFLNMVLFPQTKALSTYLYSFAAGDYQEIKCEKPHKGIPMSLYCIQSLFPYMKQLSPFIFEITNKSFEFYESFFKFDYAFNKYDQVFGHEFKFGAMQNAGISIYNDMFLFKEKVSINQLFTFAVTISHELSHHWFGNLVTMKWWDDLWLNQSFADFISHFCLSKIEKSLQTAKFESSMNSFLNRKAWGYDEDQRITTHPIRGSVKSAGTALSIFDGITYAKGAATMKQLLFLMQEEKFSIALSNYFKKYAFKNATLQDFINELQGFFQNKDFSLDKWKQVWLEKASLNLIQSNFSPYIKQPNSFMEIRQSAVTAQYPTLRPHKIKIGMYKQNGNVDQIETLIKASVSTMVPYKGNNQYKAVLLNYQDHGFVKIVIDAASLKFFTDNFEKVEDSISRTLIWNSFFDMIKDGKLSSDKYVQFLIKNVSKESSDSIFEKQYDYVYAAINGYTPYPYREKLFDQMYDFTLEQLKGLDKFNPANTNRIVMLKERLCNFAVSPQKKRNIIDWKYKRYEHLGHLNMTIGQQWKAVVKAFTLSDISNEQKEAMFTQQQQIDPSDTSKLKRETCTSLNANKQKFEQIYNSFKDPANNSVSISMKSARAVGWNSPIHRELLKQYKARYFKDIPQVAKVLEGDHLQVFVLQLIPIDDDLDGTVEEFQKIKLEGQKYDKLNNQIQKTIDDFKKRSKAYKYFNQVHK